MPSLFLSDLHLCPQRSEKIALFNRFLAGPARTANAVYILGDLFEDFWLGDDDHTPPAVEVLNNLQACSKVNPNLYFLRGNRDLMAGAGFAQRSGCRLLEDETLIKLGNQSALLMHGDLLCSHDISYQRFRRFLETPCVRRLYLAFPYFLRQLLSHGLRPLLKKSSARKKPQVVDVDKATVIATMQKHAVDLLIHGHTHRPAIHALRLADKAARRIVLGDWYAQAVVLVWEKGEGQLVAMADLLSEK